MTATLNVPVIARLKHGREKLIAQGHPWVFSGAVAAWEGTPAVGAVTEVLVANGAWLARGLMCPGAALAVRIYTRQREQPLDEAFFTAAVDRAVALRRTLPGFGTGADAPTNAWRLVFSESDSLSGLIVDQYAGTLVVQVGAAALQAHLPALIRRLVQLTGAANVRVTAETEAVQREGLDPAAVAALGNPAAGPVRIREHGLLFDVDHGAGQKTGFFLDQRLNRQRVAAYARGRRMLSAYCYTGAFEVYAAAAGAAEITGLDRSESALARAREHHRLNGLNVPVTYERADVPAKLRAYRDAGRTFDLIVLDPPRFVASRAQMENGLRAYKDINLLALKLLAPGGILATFSCSGLVNPLDFRRLLGWAAVDAQRPVQILETLGQPPDHPVLATFPESEYLKGAICTVR